MSRWLEQSLPWDSLPQEAAQPSEYWLSRGLKSLYILDSSRWKINQVTGRVGGASVGTGPTFPDGWLRTPGTANNGATLEHGLSVDIALPITLVVGWRRISGSVSWSLLDDVSAWTGWYGGATGEIATSNSNSFNGQLTLGDGGVAFCHISAAELIGASRTGTAIDTSTTVPSAVSPSTVALGWARRGTGSNDNPAVAEFTHFAAIQGALDRADLALLAHRPWELFERRIWVPVSAAGGGSLDISGGAAVSLSAALTATGDLQFAVPFDIAGSKTASLTADLSISGDLEFTEAPTLDLVADPVSVAGFLSATGDLAYELPIDLAADPISIAGTLSASGDIESTTDIKLDVSASALAVTGSLSASGDITITPAIVLDLDASPISIGGTVDVTGDLGIGEGFNLSADPIVVTGAMSVSGDVVGRVGQESSGRIVRRRRTKFPKPPEEPAAQVAPADEPKPPVGSLISQDSMTLLVQKQAQEVIKQARVTSKKRRIKIEQEDERAIERALLEWF